MKKSYFGVPLSLIFHLVAINTTLFFLTPVTYCETVFGVIYYNLVWLIITHSIKFYSNSRRNNFRIRTANFLRLFVLFGLVFFTSFIFFGQKAYSSFYLTGVYAFLCVQFVLFRLVFRWARTQYRSKAFKKSKVVVVGWDKNLKKVRQIFDSSEHNYEYVGFFDNKKSKSPTYLGAIENCFEYIFENDIQEVFCIASRLSKNEIKSLMSIADNSFKRIRIIPDNKEFFSRAMSIELYGAVPVLNLRASQLELEYANLVKRSFDIVFSSFVILFILSWLTPLVYILQKLDSKGPLFFKQKRNGVNKNSFLCYKFRSMTESKESDTKMASKNDMRVTRLGKILRKTSIDELPQFFNVLKGDMSVVGPRPHMQLHTEQYQEYVDKYLVRHFLKPGITGLAQVKGYRGEILKMSDIVNRVRFDIFYMEKWSLRLDMFIIYLTVYNIFKGEEKAY
ncbi:undecaprenyl-phosphate glucose phosphotransferase [Hyunsoonleella pacifica]|uniref:Undecaprenyl-phosphate glucose phosphotransferase n=1 Tax=Hyunsoonleella pacifica TaxID=1080224 RepID=A0A4Q9FRV2_9FLAO|nr:undecaprenyl-phosphate glucose phosphotransferase [Hyunsoonleella pacifica]TBN18637.1 undecaprenyl-phosphate glucose phosphotransferase [Hyunsoonleella pacifica]GGD03445.1 undecaprenyl-phosphate glucose phosphotransferase [Hyunsoonleella pacifica]